MNIFDSRKSNLEMLLENHYRPYSQKRMDTLIGLLKEYKVDITDIESIDLLIQVALKEQEQSDYIAPLKTPLKVLGTLILPIITYVANQFNDNVAQDKMVIMAVQSITIIIMIFSVFLAIRPIIKYLIYRDYNKYNDLISDLTQVKIFYSKGS